LLEHAGVQQKVNLENKYAGSSNKAIQPASGTAATGQNIGATKNDLQNRLHQLSK